MQDSNITMSSSQKMQITKDDVINHDAYKDLLLRYNREREEKN